jgi:NAD(P)-dependent dehydrogenase (short-subunit alcohol dehydrogenase family)
LTTPNEPASPQTAGRSASSPGASANAIDLSGKVAVVTGAAAGLGRAEAIGLARAGATVVVNDIAAALNASDVIDEITSAGSKAVAVAGDISQRETADELVSTADGLGGLGIVVNNAGITRDRMLFNMSDEEWDAVIAVHLRGHFLLTRNAATYWRQKAKDAENTEKSGGSIYGRIINTSSEAGLTGPIGQANYGAAKAGIISLTLTAARGLGRYGVCANAIAPRARTAMTAEVFGAEPEVAGGEIDPLSPEHVVTLVQFLSSPAAKDVNGQVFVVYGPQVTLMAAPTIEHRFEAGAQAWTPEALGAELGGYFAGRDPKRTFSARGLVD